MSLVHDALQKAARERQRKAGIFSPATSSPVAPQSPPQTATPVAAPAPVGQASAPATPVQSNRSHFALLSIVVVSVAIVAMVAIVWTVMRSERAVPVVVPTPVIDRPATSSAPARTDTAAPKNPVPQSQAAAPALEPAVSSAPGTPPKLTGIMGDPDGRISAILNGRTVYEGYEIDGFTVKRIDPDKVIVEKNGQESTLRQY